MPYWVYILQNEITGKLYKGQTSDLESCLNRHNSHESGSMRHTYRQKWSLSPIYPDENLKCRDNYTGNRGYDTKPLKFRDVVLQKNDGQGYGHDR